MPITVDTDDNIILMTFTDEWGWSDVYDAVDITLDIAARVRHELYLVIDLRRNSFMPPTGMIDNFRQVAGILDNQGNIVATAVVFGRSQLRTLITTALDRYGSSKRPYYYVDTMDDAYNLARGS